MAYDMLWYLCILITLVCFLGQTKPHNYREIMGVSNIQLGQPPFWMMSSKPYLRVWFHFRDKGSKIEKCHTDSTTVSFHEIHDLCHLTDWWISWFKQSIILNQNSAFMISYSFMIWWDEQSSHTRMRIGDQLWTPDHPRTDQRLSPGRFEVILPRNQCANGSLFLAIPLSKRLYV